MMNTKKGAEGRRQFVNYSFFKLSPEWRKQPDEERRFQKEEAVATLKRWCTEEMRVLTYSTVGLRSDCDLLLWRICYSIDCLSSAHADLIATKLGGFLSETHSFLGMTRHSQYLIDEAHHEHFDPRGIIRPGNSRYLFVNPLSRKREWYQLPFEERQRMVTEQVKLSEDFRGIRKHVSYSMGLDDQDFVVAYECDQPELIVDLQARLRDTDASTFTASETPSFSCIRTTFEDAFARLG